MQACPGVQLLLACYCCACCLVLGRYFLESLATQPSNEQQQLPGNQQQQEQQQEQQEQESRNMHAVQLPQEAGAAEFFDLRRRGAERRNRRLLNFTFHLGAGDCGENVETLVVVMTRPGSWRRRRVMRNTWLLTLPPTARAVFFVAGAGTRRLLEESRRHSDIVLVPQVAEAYRNLTLKVLAALQFACRHCPGVVFVAKVDDDSLLNVRALTAGRRRRPALEFVAGCEYSRSAVQRSGRWAVEQRDYPFRHFPSYMFGGAYLLRADACRLVAAARRFRVFPVEDAFVTGVLAAALRLRQWPDNAAFACKFANHAGAVSARAFRDGVAFSATDMTDAGLRRFWKSFSALQLLPRVTA